MPTTVSAADARPAGTSVPLVAAGISAGAWIVLLFTTGGAETAGLHHNAPMEGAVPHLVGLPLFLGAWMVMVAAMMLPASAPAIRELAALPTVIRQPITGLGRFLLFYSLIWTAFGIAAFVGNAVIHHLHQSTPWLAERPWLIAGSVFALAGVFELTPLKRRWLETCRDPGNHLAAHNTATRFGVMHALACVGSSGALMLVMFGAGLGNLVWMAVLTAVMAYQAVGRRGMQVVPVVGVALLALALLTLVGPRFG